MTKDKLRTALTAIAHVMRAVDAAGLELFTEMSRVKLHSGSWDGEFAQFLVHLPTGDCVRIVPAGMETNRIIEVVWLD
jgi:hypothetical protein